MACTHKILYIHMLIMTCTLTLTQTPLEQIQAQTRSLVHSMAKMKDTINDLNERNQLLESFIRQMAQKQGITAENLDEKEDDREDHYSSI